LNPGLKLPDKAIAAVHRSDGSGTNFIFTHYLSIVDPDFKAKIGENTSVEFPGGLGGKGNEGVAALISRTDGAIGYVEYAYALQAKMTYTLLRNQDGAFVSPNADTFQAAAVNAEWLTLQLRDPTEQPPNQFRPMLSYDARLDRISWPMLNSSPALGTFPALPPKLP
jgi:phosphate transport system substrate-binding protein